MPKSYWKKTVSIIAFFWIAVGAFFAALAIRIFLIPNQLIDGGVIGYRLILARLFGDATSPFSCSCLNLPFIYLAYGSSAARS